MATNNAGHFGKVDATSEEFERALRRAFGGVMLVLGLVLGVATHSWWVLLVPLPGAAWDIYQCWRRF